MDETVLKFVEIGAYKISVTRCLGHGDLNLSKRESELLRLLCREQTLKEVARCMDISPNSAATIRNRIYRKLGVNSVAGAVAVAAAFSTGAQVVHKECA